MNKILIVDDDAELRSHLSDILGEADYHTDTASSGAEAISMVASNEFDIILLDMMMPETSGMEILGEIRKIAPSSKVVMITAFACIDTAVEAMKKGASGYLPKPFKISELIMTIKKTLEEAKFNMTFEQFDLDETLASLTNYIRRDILKLLDLHKRMRLMEITRALELEDHTKVVFHLRTLKNSRIIRQQEKSYVLTKGGKEMLRALRLLENHLPQ